MVMLCEPMVHDHQEQGKPYHGPFDKEHVQDVQGSFYSFLLGGNEADPALGPPVQESCGQTGLDLVEGYQEGQGSRVPNL